MLMKQVFKRMFSSSVPLRAGLAIPEHIKKVEDAEDPNVHEMILYYFHKAIRILEPELRKIVDEEKMKLSEDRKKFRVEGIVQLISNCAFTAEITFPVKTDKGDYELVTGYKAHHSTHRTPMLGGILLHPCITAEDVMGLSALNTLKSAMISVPFGGSQGAIRISPTDFTSNDIQKITRRYIVELLKKNIIGPGIDTGSNDMNTGQHEMSWMTDTYMKVYGSTDINAMAIMSGKPTFGGGVPGNMAAIGVGIFNFLEHLLCDEEVRDLYKLSGGWENKTFVVEGLGNVGYNAAMYLKEAGCKMIGVIEKDGSFYDEEGLDPEDMAKYKFTHGGLCGYPKGKPLPEDAVRSKKCDILLLCAWHKSIKKSNADAICAKIVVEGADAPTTPAADKILRKKNILVVPDICAGGGGVVSSYFEWMKNIRHIAFGRLTASVLNEDLPSLIEAMDASLKKTLGPNASLMPSEAMKGLIFRTREKDIVKKNLSKNLRDSACLALKSVKQYNLGTNLRIGAYCRSILKVFKSYEAAGLAV